MSEPRHSRRADGRGWGGRGDSSRRRGVRREAGRREPGAPGYPPGQRPDSEAPGATPGRSAPSGDEPPPEHSPLHGPEESPWVRFEQEGGPPPHFARMRAAAGEARSSSRQPPFPDLSTLLVLLEGLRGLVPRELSSQVTALLREVLLTLRALIDWYLERLDGEEREAEVEDIPID
jgi:hypothetical protein